MTTLKIIGKETMEVTDREFAWLLDRDWIFKNATGEWWANCSKQELCELIWRYVA